MQNEVLEDDHIWPISISKWDGELDLNRLGNRMDIPKKTNRKKGSRTLSEEFIQKHKLDLLGYPSCQDLEDADAHIGDAVRKLDSQSFNSYCAERENAMIRKVCDSIKEFKAKDVKC